MATLYTRIYTYTGQSNTASSARAVALSKFKISGDTTHTVRHVVSVSFEHYHTSTGTPNYGLQGRLNFSDGTSLLSDIATHKFNSDVYKFTNTWASLPSESQWAKLSSVETIIASQSGSGTLYWRALSDYPMRLIVKFYDTPPIVYDPKITRFLAWRVGDNGVSADDGNRIRMTIRLSLASVSHASLASLKLYCNSDAAISFTSANISSMIAADYTTTLPKTYSNGVTHNLRLVFSCGEEKHEAHVSVPHAFATLHMSGCSKGGVALGKFSASTDTNPLFECGYPAHFNKGVHFDGATGAGVNSLFVVPGESISYSGNIIIPGYTSGSRKYIYISVPVGKFLNNVSTVTVKAITGWMRNEGGYGLSSGFVESGNDYLSLVTSTAIDRASNTVYIYISRSTAFSLTNNQPLTFVPASLVLEFK